MEMALEEQIFDGEKRLTYWTPRDNMCSGERPDRRWRDMTEKCVGRIWQIPLPCIKKKSGEAFVQQ